MEIIKIEFKEIICKGCGRKLFVPADADGIYKCAKCGYEGVSIKNEK